MEMYPHCIGINMAAISRAIETTIGRMVNEFLACDYIQIAITPGQLTTTDAEFAFLTMRHKAQRAGLKDMV